MTSDEGSKGSGGGGGGGAGGTGAAASGGEWVQAESLWEKYTSSIDSLYELGDYIGDTLTQAMNDIDWDSVYQSASNFGSGLASFLNGLISPELFGAVGTTIAGALNTALHGLDSFGETFDWEDFGNSIATGINNFFATFDFALLADTLNTWVDGLKTALVTAITKIDWEDIMDSFLDFWNEIELDTLTVIVGAVLFKKGLLGKFAKGILKTISNGISISKLPIIIKSFGSISIPAIQVIGNEIIDKVDEFIIEHFGESAVNAMGEGLLIAVSTGAGALAGPIGAAIGLAIGIALDTFIVKGEWITKFWSNFGENVFNFDFANSLLDQAKTFFENAFNADNFLEFGTNIVAGIGAGLTAGFFYLTEPLADLFAYIVDGICSVFGIHSPAEKMKPYGKYILLGIIQGFSETISEWITELGTWASETFNTFQTNVSTIVSNVVLWFSELPGNIYEVISGVVQDIATWGSNVYAAFTTELGNIVNYIAGEFSTAWQNGWNGVQSIFKTIWEEMPDFIKTPIRTIIGLVNKMISGIEAGLNAVIDGINGFSFDVPDWVPEIGGETFGFSIGKVSLPRIPELAKGGVVTQSTLALIGENGAEAVMPLERNTAWISTLADDITSRMGGIPVIDVSMDMSKYRFNPMDINADGLITKFQGNMDVQMSALSGDLKRQNELLEDIVTAIDNKQLQIGDEDVFKAAQRAQRREYRRTFKTGWAGI